MTGPVLIVDDDRDLREALSQTLELAGYHVSAAAAFIAAKDHITRDFPGVVVSDMMMPGRDGFHLLDYARSIDADLPVILLTGQGTVPTAVKALDEGAFAFLEKPCASADLLACVAKAQEARQQVLQSRKDRADRERGDAASRMLFGVSAQSVGLRARARAVARTHAEVIVTGEPGSGISKLAEVIHLVSPAAHHPFTKEAAAVLTVEGLDAALAATGAGTLFIDELRNVPAPTQYHLLSKLEAGMPARIIVGGTGDLQADVTAGRVNGDLFYRLDLMRVHIPALRERAEDIPVLFRHYVALACEQANVPVPEISPELTARLMAQDWPGNARALMNTAMRFALGVGEVEPEETLGLAAQMAQIEKGLIIEALRSCQGQATATAKRLQLPRKTLYDKLAKYGLRPEDFRAP